MSLAQRAMIHVDPVERRRVQNRIAQRGYRQRLKESQKLQKLNAAKEAEANANAGKNDKDNSSGNSTSETVTNSTPNTKTKTTRTGSKSNLETDAATPAAKRPQLQQNASTGNGRDGWSNVPLEQRLHSPQKPDLQHLQSQEQQHRTQPPLKHEEDQQHHLNQVSEEQQQAHLQQIQQLVRPGPPRQQTQPANSQHGSPHLSDQLSVSSHRAASQAMEGENGVYSRYMNSQSPIDTPSLYMASSSSSSVSPFETFMDPVLMDTLPSNGQPMNAPNSLQRASRSGKSSTAGSTKGEVTDSMPYVHEHTENVGDSYGNHWSESATASLYGGTALHRAVFYGHERVVEALLKAGANPEVRNRQGRTAMHLVAQSGRHSLLVLLLEHKADPQARTCTGQTPLHLAARNDEQTMVKSLLRAHVHRHPHQNPQGLGRPPIAGRVDINVADSRGWTPLHVASEKGHHGMVRVLVENGANLEQRDLEGLTALHHASIAGREAAVKLLLDMGADISG